MAIKSFFWITCSAVLAAALPSAFAEPIQAPTSNPTQISFTRDIYGRSESFPEYHEHMETVVFHNNFTATRLVSDFSADSAHKALAEPSYY